MLLTRPNPARWGPAAILPDYGRYSIADLPAMVERLFRLADPRVPLAKVADQLPEYDRVVFLLVDGLGYRKLESLFDRFPDLATRSLAKAGLYFPITSVFPATTVSALASLTTGRTPLEHGMIGYRLYLRETSAITNMVRFAMVGNGRSDAAFGAGLDADSLVPGPTLPQRLQAHGVVVHTLLPQHIAGSGLSVALYKGSSHLHASTSLNDMLVTARTLLARASSKTFLSLYWPGLDTTAHVRGPDSDAFTAEARALDDALRRELIGQVDRTLLVLCADHGFVPMGEGDYVRLPDAQEFERSLLLPPVGEPRATYLFTREGERAHVSEALTRHLGDGLICVDSQTLISDGLLGRGAPHPELESRIGDLAVVSTGRAGLFHPYQDAVFLPGMHGGVTADEMLVPLIVCPL